MTECSGFWVGAESAGPPPLPPPAPDDRVAVIRQRHLRILVIDDEDDYREAVVDELAQRYAAFVRGAESGEKGLQHAEEVSYHVVVVDFGLDGINGIDVCRQIIERDHAPTLILVSALHDATVAAAANQLGITYMDKPMDDELVCLILFNVAKGQPHE